MKKTILLFFIFILLSFFSYSQNFNYRLFSAKDGLAQNTANCILQDSRGFLWIGTNDGISIYDGYTFSRFNATQGTINSKLIISMSLDLKRQLIWIATVDKGLFIYDQRLDKVHRVESIKNPSNIRNMLLDKDGNVFLSTNRQVLKVVYDDESGKVLDFISLFKSSEKCLINSIKIDGYKNLWIGANKFLYKLSLEKGTVESIKDSIFVRNLISYKDILYCASDKGFFRINNLNDQLTKLNNLRLNNAFFDSNGRIWFFTNDGIFLADQNFKIKIKECPAVPNRNNVMEDHTGNIWFCTERNGIGQLMKRQHGFKSYSLNKRIELNNSVESFFLDSYNHLWIGTNSGVYVRNKVNKCVKIFGESKIHKITKIPNENKLFFAGDYVSYFLNLSDDLSKVKKEKINEFKYNIFDSYISEKYYWLATYNNGLVRINRNNLNDRKEFLIGCDEDSLYSSNPVRRLLLDYNNDLWVCTAHGVYILPKAERLEERYDFQKVLIKSEFLNDYFVTIMQAHDGKIWLGSLYDGLYCLTPKDSFYNFTCVKYDTDNGLSNNCIKAIQEDKAGSIWVSTNKGINKIEVENEKILKYSMSDGFLSPEFSENAVYPISSSSYAFGCVNGFTIIYVDSIEENQIEPKLVISKIEINNKLHKGFFRDSSIVLKYDKNNINIDFAALDYDFPTKNLYKYKLFGFENKWNYCNYQSRNARYTNLSPGNYTFVFNGSNQDGVWCKRPYKVNIEISNPFWFSSYAYIIYLFLIMLIFLILFKVISLNNKRSNEIIISRKEKEQTEKMTNIKIAFFTNISHELRTPITLISLPLQQIINSNEIKSEKGLKNLHKIDKNISSLLRLTDQLLNFAKNEYGNLKPNLSKNDIVPFLKNMISQFEDWAEKKNVKFVMENAFNSYIFYFDNQLMEQIFYNLFSNALKYTVENSSVYITVKRVEKSILISIADEGYGMSEDMKGHLFDRFYRGNNKENENVGGTGLGLYLTKSLVELQKGTITCESFINKGTKFIIKMPLDDSLQLMNESHPVSLEGEELKKEDLSISKTMLIVDDNFEILDVLEDVFSDGYKIVKAFNGKQALEIANNIVPNFIISDIMMPLLDGYELCEMIKSNSNTSHIPIILLTAKDSIKDKVKGLNLSADGYCTKPFDINELKSLVYSITNNRKLLKTKNRTPLKVEKEEEMSPIDSRFISKITEIINKNISNTDFHVEQLSKEMGMNNNTLCKKVKTLTSQTTAAFIRSIRLDKAAELLMYNSNSVADITYEVGFVDLKYFRTCFKKKFGCSPSEYYKLHKKDNK